jgi:hypothetical protein
MPRGWTKNLHKEPKENVTFLVLGVTMTGPWRAFAVLDSFSLSPSHVKNGSPVLVNSIDALNHDYLMVVEESVARRNGWLK